MALALPSDAGAKARSAGFRCGSLADLRGTRLLKRVDFNVHDLATAVGDGPFDRPREVEAIGSGGLRCVPSIERSAMYCPLASHDEGRPHALRPAFVTGFAHHRADL